MPAIVINLSQDEFDALKALPTDGADSVALKVRLIVQWFLKQEGSYEDR